MLNNKAYGNCEAIIMLTDKISNPGISYIIPGVILAGGLSSIDTTTAFDDEGASDGGGALAGPKFGAKAGCACDEVTG